MGRFGAVEAKCTTGPGQKDKRAMIDVAADSGSTSASASASASVSDSKVPVQESEAYKVLLTRVGRRSPKIPAELLVQHIMRLIPASEWPTRLEAMDAMLRRLE